MSEANHERVISELLRDLIIVELAKIGCSNEEIRKIVKADNNRVSRIAGPIRKVLDRNVKRQT